jgi:lysozyme
MAVKKQNKARKKRSKWWIVLVLVVLALAGYSGFIYWRQMQEERRAKFAVYPAFGIRIPLGYSIHGIDVSNYQEFIYWPSIKQMKVEDVQLKFAFIKATEGLKDADKQFKHNWQSAKQVGMCRGAYHYFIATKSGKQQALNFINTVKLEPGDLPPVLDIEDLYGVDPAVMRTGVTEWLQTVEAAYKVKPIIYSFEDFYNNYLGRDYNDYPLWVAHFVDNDKPRVRRSWAFWQHSDAGKVNGITTKVDFDVFGGDSLQFKGLLVK